jgi:hypothetical protein
MTRARIIGVYAALPADPARRRSLTSAVLDLPGCDGLEIPFGSVGYEQDRLWLWDRMPPGRTHVFTLVAATMEALARDELWGPASSSEAGRAAFLNLLRDAREEVARVTAAGHRVVAVEIQSAPRGTARSAPDPGALQETLASAASWDWCGASLAIEHCDAYRDGQPHAKGFLQLTDEITVAQDVTASSSTRVGLTINWGRSAIDRRTPDGPDEQLVQAQDAGVLLGLMASGATATDGPFDPAWSDSHAPMFADDPRSGEPTSLLTAELLGTALRAAGDGLDYEGLKIGIRPPDTSLDGRLALISRMLMELQRASR